MTRHAVRTARLGVVVVAMAVATSSCGSERRQHRSHGPVTPTTTVQPARSGEPPADEPDFVGTITAVTPGRPMTLLVEASRSEPVGTLGDKASLRVDAR